jgi:hypothetical protein
VRIIVNLPNDVYQAVRTLSQQKGISLGGSLAELVRRGLKLSKAIDNGKAFPCFVLPDDTEPITLEQTLEAEDEL